MKNRIRAVGTVIRSMAEMEAAVGLIRQLTIQRNRVMLDREEAHKVIDERCGPELARMEKEMEKQTEHVRCWAESNPSAFNGVKGLETAHGVIGWRTGQPTLKTLSGWTWDRVLERIKATKGWYVRVKEEVNKQAVIGDREALGPEALRDMGVKVVQEEVFYVEPKIEEVENRREGVAA